MIFNLASGRGALVLTWLLHVSAVFASAITERVTTAPAPIAFTPDENWDGIDGSWSSFTIRIGTPSQTVRVFASWMSYQTWVVGPKGCMTSTDYDSCAGSRGEIFNSSQSTTWDSIGLYSLWIEQNLGYEGNAAYGYDTVTLGGLGEGGTTLLNTTVGAFAITDFYLGNFGLNPKPTNWTSYDDPAPSYMTQLKDQNLIPSVSFGYTAGAQYRFTGVLASLTLGGYDNSRFVKNNVEFTFAADNERDTVVAIQSITTPSQDGSSADTALLPTPIYALVDATVAQIWLPIDACEAFEEEFGLVYDNTTDLYLVDNSMHDTLLARNAKVSFTLGQTTSGGPTVTITLPYAAFDLTAQPPYQGLANNAAYFPLRRAQNDTQYTLGRTFMQEAYITVDYERAMFNISQCSWVDNAASHLVAINGTSESENSGYSGAGTTATTTMQNSPSSSSTSSPSSSSSGVDSATNTSQDSSANSSSLSGGSIGGIVAGIVVVVLAILALLFWYLRRNRKARLQGARRSGNSSSSSRASILSETRAVVGGIDGEGTRVIPKAELEGSNTQYSEKTGFLVPHSVDASLPTSPSSQGLGADTYVSSQGSWSNGTWVVSPLSAGGTSEADGHQVYEMPGDMPELPQADGRQITEKDMMKRREEMYNGVDRSSNDDVIAQAGEERQQERERRTVQAGDAVTAAPHSDGHPRFSFEGDESSGTNSFTTTPSSTSTSR